MLKIAIIGCGNIADTHANQIRRINGADLTAVCDKEIMMAEQFSERFNIKYYFDDAHEMLKAVKPDIVHITSAPGSHYTLGRLCLEKGIHVYIEKPFTVLTAEAEELIEIANNSNLKITVGHNAQFTPIAISMRRLIEGGYLGGDPVHMESIYCYSIQNAHSASALIGDKDHWIRQLPGKLLHNIISHGVARIAEFLSTSDRTVIAHGSTSPLLSEIGETSIVDELRVIISDNRNSTGYFTFSSQMNPPQHLFRVYGTKNSVLVDHAHRTLIKLPGKHYKSYLNQFIPPLNRGTQYIGSARRNLIKFLRNDFHSDAGMKNLIQSFYHSITKDSPVPIPYREILLTSRIMESIFEQLGQTS